MDYQDDDLTPGQLRDINNYFIECNAYSEMTFEQLEKRPLWRYRENYYYEHHIKAMYGMEMSKLNLN